MKTRFRFSFVIDGYQIAVMEVAARNAKQARELIRARYRGRKLTSFLPA